MKKQQKQFWILFIFVALIGAGYLMVHFYHVKKEEASAKKDEASKVYVCQIPAEEITGFTYNEDKEQVTFEKDGDSFVDPDDTKTLYLQDYFTTMESAVKSLEASQVIEAPSDTDQYGFDEPTKTIIIHRQDGDITLIIGDYNDTIQGYYVMKEGSDDVYIVDETLFQAFDHEKKDMKDTDNTDSD